MKINVEKCAGLLKKENDFAILCHAHPDGDTLGSGFALLRALQKLGKRAKLLCDDEIPSKYEYLYSDIESQDFEEKYIIAVDVATENLLGGLQEKYAGRVDLCIDHHGTNTDYAKNLLLNADAAANCEIILKVIKALGVVIDKKMAECLYTGLTTDTGCFRYSSTTSNTYRSAAELIDLGADNGYINRLMFETKTKKFAALERLAIEGMQFFLDERVCVITITNEMYKKTGTTELDTEALPPLTRQIEGVEIGLTIREKNDGACKCSIRTYESVNAAQLAQAFGGGGHKQAAACRFDCDVKTATDLLVEKSKELLR